MLSLSELRPRRGGFPGLSQSGVSTCADGRQHGGAAEVKITDTRLCATGPATNMANTCDMAISDIRLLITRPSSSCGVSC